jgi:predicted GIY-YIG superfamily endonuclease
LVELHPSKVDVEGSSPFSRFLLFTSHVYKTLSLLLTKHEKQKILCWRYEYIQRRITEHNSGLVRSSSPHKPWKLMRVEEFSDINTAYQRERFIKSKRSRKIIETIIMSGNL